MKAQPGSQALAVRSAPPAERKADVDDAPSSTALERYGRFGNLPASARAEVQRSRAVREVADMIGVTAWGAQLTPVARAALAKWCIRRDVDPITELDNVGGPYVNAEYFQRKLGELRIRGIVSNVEQINIAPDPRLEALAKDQHAPEDDRAWAAREHYRRLRLRATYGVPEEAAAACLTLLHLAAGGEPIAGVKWGGNGTSVKQPKHGGGSAPNPIVEANPTLSVESQSIRRAMRQLALMMPAVLPELDGLQTELAEIRGEGDTSSRGAVNPPGAPLSLGAPGAAGQAMHGYEGAELPAERIDVKPIEAAVYDEDLALDREIVQREASEDHG